MKAIVGVAGYFFTRTENHLLDLDINTAPKELTKSIREADMLPLIIPLSNPLDAKAYIDQVDALVLAGGADIDPLLYNEEPLPELGITEPERDLFELALIKEAWKQEKPIMGICRGLQILNVAFGGSLYQDLSYYPELEVAHIQKTPWQYPTHSVTIAKDSLLAEALGTKSVINSYHHQSIKELADVFKPIAWSTDGIIEAFESNDSKQNVLAMQWHPELLLETTTDSIHIFKKFNELVQSTL